MTDSCKFMTEVEVTGENSIDHGHHIWTIGSCFADEIGTRMSHAMLNVEVNPLGTLYNPLSIADALRRVAERHRYSMDDLLFNEGRWHSLDFHSSFSGRDPDIMLNRLNSTIARLHEGLRKLDWLMLTLGSARVFIDNDSGKVAANCHKLPASRFTVRDVTADEAAQALTEALRPIMEIAPQLKVIFTVSPIRHKAYGYHADRLSKASLLLAADRMVRELPQGHACYFPAYEIMQDELRDYRFYAADMIHPSETAADHIYSRFAGAWFSARASACAARCRRLHGRLCHRPSPDEPKESRQRFVEDTLRLADSIIKEYPEAAETIGRAIATLA